jgi:hypothetical protein
MQHPTFSATLAEQRREELRRQADQARFTRGGRRNGRRREWRSSRWWWPATRPAQP